MKTIELAGHSVMLYDSIDELPIKRFHVYNRYLLVDAGVGSDISDFDNHVERVVQYFKNGDAANACKELDNLRQNVYLVLSQQNVKHLSLACLVKQIDGVRYDDLSQEGLQKVIEVLGGASVGEVSEAMASVKKKIDDELLLYFPALFDDVRTREYYDIVKRLTLTMLEQVCEGTTEERKEKADKMHQQLLLFSRPKVFTGHDGLEVRHDKDFETMCLVISQETGADAKRMTVLEYYNAYEYIKQKAKKGENKAR